MRDSRLKHWVIRGKNVAGNTLTIKAAREVGLSPGDAIVVLSWDGDSLSFAWHAEIVDRLGSVKLDDAQKSFRFEIGEPRRIENPLSVLDLGFSLLKVYRHQRPDVHFRRPYTRILPVDFESIVKGRVFWARTALGVFVSQLPRSAIDSFIRDLAAKNPRMLVKTSYRDLWNAFRKIVIGELLSAHTLLQGIKESCDTDSIIQGATGADFNNLKLYDSDVVRSDVRQDGDSLAPQFQRLARLKAALGQQEAEMALLDDIEAAIHESDWEERFEKVFENQQWQELLNY